MDLNIVARNCGEEIENGNLLQQVLTAFKLGYQVVALNTIIEGSTLEGKNIKVPDPLIIEIEKHSSEIQISNKKYKVLNRLTVIVSGTNHLHKLKQLSVIKKYDLIALQPTNKEIFQNVCGASDFDILTFDFTTRLPFLLRHNNCRQALKNGIVFEIQYSPCITSSSNRKMVIGNATNLVEIVNGKNLILTSGSIKVMELRSPKDVANLGLIFGMSQDKANASVNQNCRGIITHSEVRRKTGFGVVSIQEICKVAENEKWLKEACTYLTKLESEMDPQKSLKEENKIEVKKRKIT